MTKTSKRKVFHWTEEQIEALVELLILHRGDLQKVTSVHNHKFGLDRSEAAIAQQWRNLREALSLTHYKKTWALMLKNQSLFTRHEPKRIQADRRIAELEQQVKALMATVQAQQLKIHPVASRGSAS